MKKILTLLLSLMLLFSFAGCQSDDMNEYPVILANYTITEKPESIVCLSDSVADILCEMGLEHPGAPGTTAALALLNDQVKKIKVRPI